MVEAMPDTLMRDSTTYKNAVRFGLVIPNKKPVVFYFNGGYKKMKNGIHGNREQLEELSVNRILGELYDKAKAENDGKVHIREIEDGHIGDTIELY